MMSSLGRRAALGVLAMALLAPAGCSDDGPGAGEARLEVDGLAVVERDGDRKVIDDGTDLRPGDRVEVTEGVGRLVLRDGVRMEMRAGLDGADHSALLMGEIPVLEAGDLLVAAPERTAVEAAGTTVGIVGGAARMSRQLGVGVAAYDATIQLDSAGQEREVPALREMQVPALGRPPRAPRPLTYDPTDPWDLRLLGDAIALGERLEDLAGSYTRNLTPGQGRTPGFFRAVLPGLADEPDLDDLLEPDRPAGETLVGAAISDLGGRGTFPARWSSVFGFRDEGAEWGLVALDQAVTSTPLMGSIEQAIGSSPLGFASQVAAPPDEPPDVPTTTTTAPPPPPDEPPTVDEPPDEPDPLDPVEPLAPEVEPVVEPVTDLVVDIIDGLLGPPVP